MLIIETFILYLHIINSETNLTTMKKQEMINVIKGQEKDLYIKVQKCLEAFGAHDPITESAIARWSVINQLLKTLGL